MTPEQQEIQRKKTEIQDLEQLLADSEAVYADYCVQLKHFETEYLRVIGPIYSRLDRWKMRLESAELMISWLRDVRDGVRSYPDDPFGWEIKCAQSIRQRWSRRNFVFEEEPGTSQSIRKVVDQEAKSLYRALARRFHPDLAENEETRNARTKVMAEINQAYRDQDLDKLRDIQNRPDIRDPEQETIGEALIRLIRRVAQLRRLVKDVEFRLSEQQDTDLAKLMGRCSQSEEEHGDAFHSLRIMLQSQIDRAKFEWLEQRVREARLWTEVER